MEPLSGADGWCDRRKLAHLPAASRKRYQRNVMITLIFTLISPFIYLISFLAAARKRQLPQPTARDPPAQVGGPPTEGRRNATSGRPVPGRCGPQDSGRFDRCGGGSTPSLADEEAGLGGPDSGADSEAPIPEGLKPSGRRLPVSVRLIPNPSRSLTGGTQHAGAGLEAIRDPRRPPGTRAGEADSGGSSVRRGAQVGQGSVPVRRGDERRGSGFGETGDADQT